MGRFFPWLWVLLIILWIYVALTFAMPGAMALLPRYQFEDGELKTIRTSGRFSYSSLSISVIDYSIRPGGGEFAYEQSGFSNVCVTTKKQKDGTLVISSAGVGNQLYEKTLNDHPEVLAEAKRVLRLGRDKFAKAKKKLEEQKLKRNQSDRLG